MKCSVVEMVLIVVVAAVVVIVVVVILGAGLRVCPEGDELHLKKHISLRRGSVL